MKQQKAFLLVFIFAANSLYCQRNSCNYKITPSTNIDTSQNYLVSMISCENIPLLLFQKKIRNIKLSGKFVTYNLINSDSLFRPICKIRKYSLKEIFVEPYLSRNNLLLRFSFAKIIHDKRKNNAKRPPH